MSLLVYGDGLIQVKPVEADAAITQGNGGQHGPEYLVEQGATDAAVVAGFLWSQNAGWVVCHFFTIVQLGGPGSRVILAGRSV